MHDWIHGTDGHFIWTMRQMVQLLADAQAMEVFDKAAHFFDGELARRDRRQFLSQLSDRPIDHAACEIIDR
jgi:hypothetical protein